MDTDGRDPDLVAEAHMARRRLNVIRQRAVAWDEPFTEDEFKCPRCGEMRCVDKPDGCRDPNCP